MSLKDHFEIHCGLYKCPRKLMALSLISCTEYYWMEIENLGNVTTWELLRTLGHSFFWLLGRPWSEEYLSTYHVFSTIAF